MVAGRSWGGHRRSGSTGAGRLGGGAVTGPRVALVGAGPGDPDLMTLQAEAVLVTAAIVVSDAAVQDLARGFAPMAEVVVVAKGEPAVSVLLAAVSSPAQRVVRLYAGDPWLHAAHGQELAALNRAGITTEAIPGVAIEVAVPARAGIALHVRHLAVACTLGSAEAMPAPVDPARTLVISSGDGAAAARGLVARGGQDLPAAVLPIDGRPGEVRGTLGELAAGAGDAGPSLLVVGAVAASRPAATGAERGRGDRSVEGGGVEAGSERMRGGER